MDGKEGTREIGESKKTAGFGSSPMEDNDEDYSERSFHKM